ncbi:MAG: TrkA family potassium uptake protein [Chloroflexales bacterium]
MRALILGCGRIGGGLAQRLALAGHTVMLVDPDPATFANLSPSFSGRKMVGDVLDRAVLVAAGIEQSDGLAAVTTRDDVNIVVARLARLVFHVPRVIARVYSPQSAEVYRRLGIQTVTTTTWGINRIAELLSYANLEPVASLGSDVDLMDVGVPALLVGRPVSALTRPGEIHVAAISRGGKTFLPHAGTLLEADDLLHLVVLATAADHLAALLRA